MSGTRWMAAGAFAALVIASMAAAGSAATQEPLVAPSSTDPQQLSIMTYNVEGLPFPAALDRTGPLQQIGLRLGALRRAGRQPHVVLLQEAFTPEAKAIAALSGYRFVAYGPRPADVTMAAPAVMPADYRDAAAWNKGETQGKWFDSGLAILSDYPIQRTARMAFARDACAGFDCLAAKGVLLTWIKVPGRSEPIAVADAHLNSRRATCVSDARSDAAFAEQYREAKHFILENVTTDQSVVFGGDFNIGHGGPRRSVVTRVGAPVPAAGEEVTARIKTAARTDMPDVSVAEVIGRAKDVQYYHAGHRSRLQLKSVLVPFGVNAGGYALSDHLGFIAIYDYHDLIQHIRHEDIGPHSATS